MTDEERDTADSLDKIRSHTEELIEGAYVRLDSLDTASINRALAWATVAAAKATLYLAEVIRTQGNGQPKDQQSLERDPNSKCSYCEGEFPESALNYSSGDPACAPCQEAFDLPRSLSRHPPT